MGKQESGKTDIMFGMLFLALALFTLVLTTQLRGPAREDISIKTFPMFVGIGMLGLSTLLIGKGVLSSRSAARSGMNGAKQAEQAAQSQLKTMREMVLDPFVLRFAGLAILGFLYTQFIRAAGYVVVTPVLVFGAMLLYGERKWYRLILVPLIVTFVLYHVFRTFFRVPLPRFGLW